MANISVLISIILILAGCGTANYGDEPNSIQRAEVLSKNKLGISIEHSSWGKKIAFRLADEHCEKFGKIAVYKGASQQYGPDVISTWECESG